MRARGQRGPHPLVELGRRPAAPRRTPAGPAAPPRPAPDPRPAAPDCAQAPPGPCCCRWPGHPRPAPGCAGCSSARTLSAGYPGDAPVRRVHSAPSGLDSTNAMYLNCNRRARAQPHPVLTGRPGAGGARYRRGSARSAAGSSRAGRPAAGTSRRRWWPTRCRRPRPGPPQRGHGGQVGDEAAHVRRAALGDLVPQRGQFRIGVGGLLDDAEHRAPGGGDRGDCRGVEGDLGLGVGGGLDRLDVVPLLGGDRLVVPEMAVSFSSLASSGLRPTEAYTVSSATLARSATAVIEVARIMPSGNSWRGRASGLACLGPGAPGRLPMVVAWSSRRSVTRCLDIPMALHATAALGGTGCLRLRPRWSATSSACSSTTMRQQIPPERLARLEYRSRSCLRTASASSGTRPPDGPLAAALGPATVFGVGAVYGLLSSAIVLALPAVRAVRWRDKDPAASAPAPSAGARAGACRDAPARGGVTAACGPRRAGRRTRPAARPR